MSDFIDNYFKDDPTEWIHILPVYQKVTIEELMQQGKTFEEIAETWVSATTENTYPFGTSSTKIDKGKFLENLILEIEDFICGSKKYEQERKKLFGEHGVARTYIVSAIAVAVAPTMGVSATFLAPVVALILASLGKIAVNAWCSTRKESRVPNTILQTP